MNKDQRLLEEAYQQITYQNGGYGTSLRSNYAFSQIDKEAWRGDSRFESFNFKSKDLNNWEGVLKFDGKIIKLQGKNQNVYVDGKQLEPNDSLNLRKYIIRNYATSSDTSNKFISQPAYTGKGEPI